MPDISIVHYTGDLDSRYEAFVEMGFKFWEIEGQALLKETKGDPVTEMLDPEAIKYGYLAGFAAATDAIARGRLRIEEQTNE